MPTAGVVILEILEVYLHETHKGNDPSLSPSLPPAYAIFFSFFFFGQELSPIDEIPEQFGFCRSSIPGENLGVYARQRSVTVISADVYSLCCARICKNASI